MSYDTAERDFNSFVRRLIFKALQSCKIPDEVSRAIWRMDWGDVEMDTQECMEMISLILITEITNELECNEERFFSSEINCTVFMLTSCLKLCSGQSHLYLVLMIFFLSECVIFWFKRRTCYRILFSVEFCFQAMYKRKFRNNLVSKTDYENLREFCFELHSMLGPDSEIGDLDLALHSLIDNGESIMEIMDKLFEKDENTFWTDFECNYFQELLLDNIQYDKINTAETSTRPDLDSQPKPGTSKSFDFDYQSRPGTSKCLDLDYHPKPGTSNSLDLDYQPKPGTSKCFDHDYQCKPGKSTSSTKENSDKRKTEKECITQRKRNKTHDLENITKYLDFTCEFCHTKCSQYLERLNELI